MRQTIWRPCRPLIQYFESDEPGKILFAPQRILPAAAHPPTAKSPALEIDSRIPASSSMTMTVGLLIGAVGMAGVRSGKLYRV